MKALEYFKEIGAENPDLTLGKMFGAVCFKTANGKAAALIFKDDLVVKLEPSDLENALVTNGAHMFEPMEGRQMNGWVVIPYSRKKEWADYIDTATNFVKKLPANTPKTKRALKPPRKK